MIRAAQALLVLAAAALWVASRLPWVVLQWFDELGPPRTTAVSGAQWSAALVPLAVLLLAAALAALAVRGWWLRILAVLLAASSAVTIYLGITLWMVRDPAVRAAYLADIPLEMLVSSSSQYGGAAVTVVAGVATLAAAVLMMRVARSRGPQLDKYSTHRQRGGSAQDLVDDGTVSERNIWDALDEGLDPTHESDTEGR